MLETIKVLFYPRFNPKQRETFSLLILSVITGFLMERLIRILNLIASSLRPNQIFSWGLMWETVFGVIFFLLLWVLLLFLWRLSSKENC